MRNSTNITITHTAPQATAGQVPGLPMIRFESGLTVHEEALIGGRLFGAGGSAMDRPKSRAQVWDALAGGTTSWRPLRTRQHAFGLQVDGQLLADSWEWVTDGKVESDDESRARTASRSTTRAAADASTAASRPTAG